MDADVDSHSVCLGCQCWTVGVAMGKALVYMGVWTVAKKIHAALGLLFNVWIMVLLYPFALAIMGRWAKRPIILLVLLPAVFVIVGVIYVALHILLANVIPI